MPELPEVEVTKLGVEPKVVGKTITNVRVIDGRLRWPVLNNLKTILKGQACKLLTRRGKYLIFHLTKGYLIIHLGMTGVLRTLSLKDPLKPHDRVEIQFGNVSLRLHDPRKFGAVMWHGFEEGPLEEHPLLKKLGVEPLGTEFRGNAGAKLLFNKSRKRTISVKQFLLAGQAVVGVGNIYCSESLFEAGINPSKSAGSMSMKKCEDLAQAIRLTMQKAIRAGGSSLKDFVNSEGEPGHFMMNTKVYGRAGEPCRVCSSIIKQITQGQRSTFYCPKCQK